LATILDKIVANKRRELEVAQQRVPLDVLQSRLAGAPRVRDFAAAMHTPGQIKLIAEVKRASPSRGEIRPNVDPVEVAVTYEKNGAACISVLTDGPFFQGSLDDLRMVRAAVHVPVLRKDFILDRYQLFEARLAGADAVLLIAECLDDEQLVNLHDEAQDLGMTPLVEFYEPSNLSRVLAVGPRLIGINNRDLRSFETDLDHTIRLRAQIPPSSLLVAESGIRTRQDVKRLADAGVQAMLVGESLMASADIGQAVRELLGTA